MANPGNTDLLVRFGRNVRRLRRLAELSQEELGNRVGMERSYIYRIEQAKAPGLSLRAAATIAEALETTVDALFASD